MNKVKKGQKVIVLKPDLIGLGTIISFELNENSSPKSYTIKINFGSDVKTLHSNFVHNITEKNLIKLLKSSYLKEQYKLCDIKKRVDSLKNSLKLVSEFEETILYEIDFNNED